MNEDSMSKSQLLDFISHVFYGVSLGAGTGLMEGEGMDSHASAAKLAELRAMDEKEDWKAIPHARLNQYCTGLCFMDPAGMRFHLPAFLVAHLERSLDQDILFHLIYLDNDATSRFGLLSTEQRKAVAKFLEFCLQDDPRTEPIRDSIQSALDNYWERT
ncbi:DUF6714 family protein [Aeoliella sp.]|uniref:DUF6714 family protein n=1 Tax=Aeoliella sp. TaxID=2795800 RepID=UPI003CCB91F9